MNKSSITRYKDFIVNTDWSKAFEDLVFTDSDIPMMWWDAMETYTVARFVDKLPARTLNKSLVFLSIKEGLRLWRIYRSERMMPTTGMDTDFNEDRDHLPLAEIIAMLDKDDQELAVSDDPEELDDLEQSIFNDMYAGDIGIEHQMDLLEYLWNRKKTIIAQLNKQAADEQPTRPRPPHTHVEDVELPGGMSDEEKEELLQARGVGWPMT